MAMAAIATMTAATAGTPTCFCNELSIAYSFPTRGSVFVDRKYRRLHSQPRCRVNALNRHDPKFTLGHENGRGELHVTWEEGTWAAWLYDLLQPQVQEVVVCNPRRNALLKEGSKSDKVDARKLADLLRTGMLRPVYHGENGLRTLRELARSYQTIGKDLTRVMNRLKAVYRGWGIPCSGTHVYAPRYREEWLNKLPQSAYHAVQRASGNK